MLLLQQKDQHYQQWVKETQDKLNIGIEQLNRGEGIDSEIVINRLKSKFYNRGKKTAGDTSKNSANS